ncbi:MAG: glycine betaine ABC transporter substrate-binding protein [Acetobacterium sp.]
MKKFFILIVIFLSMITIVGCSSGNDEEPIIIYDGTNSEMQIIHQMAKMVIESKTDAKVEIRHELRDVEDFSALTLGTADLMNCYDGTLLLTYLKLDPATIPEGTSIYDFANEAASKDKGAHLQRLRMLNKLGNQNSFAIAVLPKTAEKYDLKTISDLAAVSDQLIFGGENDFYNQEGTLKFLPFTQAYGLNFKESKPMDIALKYPAIDSGDIDVTIINITDGLNKQAGLKILADDRNFFPENNGALLVRNDLFERFSTSAPNLEDVLNSLGGVLTNEIITDLNYQVDVNGKKPQDVARKFLKEKSLI